MIPHAADKTNNRIMLAPVQEHSIRELYLFMSKESSRTIAIGDMSR